MSNKNNPHAIDVESVDYMHTSYENDPSLFERINGRTYICIKTFEDDFGCRNFVKGQEYILGENGRFTNEQGRHHFISEVYFSAHFVLKKESKFGEWISVEDRLPENDSLVLGLYKSTNGKPIYAIVIFQKKGELHECYDEDCKNEGHDSYDDCCFLTENRFCEPTEQWQGEFDEFNFHRKVTHWMPLPEKPD